MSRRNSLVTVASVALALTACGQVTGGAATPAGVAPLAVRQDDPPVTVSLNAARVDGLGKVVTDQNGLTLYRFDDDSADPPTSTCDAECAAKWPPVLADGELVVAGVDRGLVGTTPRVDGNRQVTLAGWPLYRFAGDRRPGESGGHGMAGAWHAVTPEGGRTGAAPEPVRIVGRDLPGFGAALTDRDGFTLYLFTRDSRSTATCADECARTWPPVLAGAGTPDLTGVDPALVGQVTRDGDARQLTVGGWPVYRYAGDTGPAQTNGHGIDGTWFVIEPSGRKSPAPISHLATGN